MEEFIDEADRLRDDRIHGWYDLSSVMSQLDARLIEDEDLIGMNLIPFGVVFGGDFVCLDYRNSTEPCISLWFHEESGDFAPVTEVIADSFGTFLDMLRS